MARAPKCWGDRRRLRVGLLGGSFNPAHDGHRHVAELALKLLRLDQVWLLVSPQNPLKRADGMAPQQVRLDSARSVLGRHHRLLATDLESEIGTRYTVDTLEKLKIRFPSMRFVWLMGADNLAQMHRWNRWKRIAALVPIAILDRSPYSRKAMAAPAAHALASHRRAPARARGLASSPPPVWVFLHTRLHPASATEIRAGQRFQKR